MRTILITSLVLTLSTGLWVIAGAQQNPTEPPPATSKPPALPTPEGPTRVLTDRAPNQPGPRPLNLHTDVLSSEVPQEVLLVEHDFAVGETSGRHIHHGVELAFVMHGDLILRIAGKPPQRLHSGDSFKVERDKPHEVVNVGTAPAALVISFLMDKGAPWAISLGTPAEPATKP